MTNTKSASSLFVRLLLTCCGIWLWFESWLDTNRGVASWYPVADATTKEQALENQPKELHGDSPKGKLLAENVVNLDEGEKRSNLRCKQAAREQQERGVVGFVRIGIS